MSTEPRFSMHPRDLHKPDNHKVFGVFDKVTDEWTDDKQYTADEALREVWRLNGVDPSEIDGPKAA